MDVVGTPFDSDPDGDGSDQHDDSAVAAGSARRHCRRYHGMATRAPLGPLYFGHPLYPQATHP